MRTSAARSERVPSGSLMTVVWVHTKAVSAPSPTEAPPLPTERREGGTQPLFFCWWPICLLTMNHGAGQKVSAVFSAAAVIVAAALSQSDQGVHGWLSSRVQQHAKYWDTQAALICMYSDAVRVNTASAIRGLSASAGSNSCSSCSDSLRCCWLLPTTFHCCWFGCKKK